MSKNYHMKKLPNSTIEMKVIQKIVEIFFGTKNSYTTVQGYQKWSFTKIGHL